MLAHEMKNLGWKWKKSKCNKNCPLWIMQTLFWGYGHVFDRPTLISLVASVFWSLRDDNRPHRSVSSGVPIKTMDVLFYVGPL